MVIKGVGRVSKSLKFQLTDVVETKSKAALHAVLSQGAAYAATITPVDTSTLINSQTSPDIKVGTDGVTGSIGYTANYAKFAHDAKGALKGKSRPGNKGQYWAPRGEPKFLEKGFDRVIKDIPKILKEVYR